MRAIKLGREHHRVFMADAENDIRAIEPSFPGSIIRFGIDGSGKVEVAENIETIADMINGKACLKA